MDHGNERDTPPGRPAGPGALPDDPVADPLAGRVPLAVVVVDRDGLVSHWSRGARRLFRAAQGGGDRPARVRPAARLRVVPDVGAEDDDTDALHSYDAYAADDGLGPGLESSLDGRLSYPAAAAPG
ncbi:hypothetical protein TPA0906_12800 [Streptomyces olivaceus]|nr:hypothetical protein TPA0906_12800 [Streptomyces olivaceus]